MSKVLCFTGHRPPKIGGYKVPNPLHSWLSTTLHATLIRAIAQHGFDHFISGGAMGVDILAALVVLNLRPGYPNITLEIAKPFPSQSSKWQQSTVDEFDLVCSIADTVTNVSDDPYSPEKMQIRNAYMVDKSEAVIAIWDGSRGGTYNCVKYAFDKNVPVFHINPATKNIEGWIKT